MTKREHDLLLSALDQLERGEGPASVSWVKSLVGKLAWQTQTRSTGQVKGRLRRLLADVETMRQQRAAQ